LASIQRIHELKEALIVNGGEEAESIVSKFQLKWILNIYELIMLIIDINIIPTSIRTYPSTVNVHYSVQLISCQVFTHYKLSKYHQSLGCYCDSLSYWWNSCSSIYFLLMYRLCLSYASETCGFSRFVLCLSFPCSRAVTSLGL
jgi:hypothetical protein